MRHAALRYIINQKPLHSSHAALKMCSIGHLLQQTPFSAYTFALPENLIISRAKSLTNTRQTEMKAGNSLSQNGD